MTNKARGERRHARQRAWERYRLDLTGPDLDRIVNDIRHGRTRCIARQSLRVSVHEVMVAGTTARVVYDKDRKQIVTFLPKLETVDGTQ